MMKEAIYIILFLVISYGVSAQEKYAVVIGNSSYINIGTLKNPANDATDMDSVLRNIGFKTELLINANLDQMENAVVKLGQKLSQSPKSYGFFYYAGHGVQASGNNYLVPIDGDIKSEAFLKSRALSVQEVLDTFQQSGNGLNIIVLDACRDNPFSWARSANRGLTVVGNQPPGSIIAYATSAGSVAQDGTGRNGLFTSQLLKNLSTPGLEIKEVFNRTGEDVMNSSNNKQVPAIYSQSFKPVYLVGAAEGSDNRKLTSQVEPQWGEVVVPRGSVKLTLASEATVEFDGQSKRLPAGGSINITQVKPGKYTVIAHYINGKSEIKEVSVSPGIETALSFAYIEQVGISRTGLIGEWNFNSTLRDTSDLDNSGSLKGGKYSIDRYGKTSSSLYLDGIDSSFSFSNFPNDNIRNTGISLSLWFKVDGIQKTNSRLFTIYDKSGINFDLSLDKDRSKLVFINFNRTTENIKIVGSHYINASEWYNLTVLISNHETRVFLNGEIDSQSNSIVVFPNSPSFILGNIAGAPWNFKGDIDDARVYSRVLDSEELRHLQM